MLLQAHPPLPARSPGRLPGASARPAVAAGPAPSSAPSSGHRLAGISVSPRAAPIQLGRAQQQPRRSARLKQLEEKAKRKAETLGRSPKATAVRIPVKKLPKKLPKKLQREIALKIQAFNLGHASASAKTGFKFPLLKQHLAEHKPDVLSLSEVNDISGLREQFGTKESGYQLVEHPEFSVGSSIYNPKTSTQYESYPLLVNKKTGLETSFLDFAPREQGGPQARQVKQDQRGSSSEAWKRSRPLPLFAVTHPEGGSFLFGAVHTSPGGTIAEQTVNYTQQLGSVGEGFSEKEAERPPLLLGGDFYNPKTKKGQEQVGALEKKGWTISRPNRLTNYARLQKNQEKKAADFFIGSKGFIKTKKTRALYPSFRGANEFENPAEAWAKFPKNQLPGATQSRKRKNPEVVTASDHAPSETEIGLKNQFLKHKEFVRRSQLALKVAKKKAEIQKEGRLKRLGLRSTRSIPVRYSPKSSRPPARKRLRRK